jgi:PleD family two-component response regulator
MPLSLVAFDADHFKSLNGEFGEFAEDRVFKAWQHR